MWWSIGVVLFLLLGWLFLIAPGHARAVQRAPFEKRAFAHRGLYAADQSVPENSLEAFRLAAEAGYGIELDVQLTKDGRIVVFHDDTLRRVTGVDGRMDAFTFDELQAFPLFSTAHRIPLFWDVLSVVDGRVPLIVELKAGKNQMRLCELTAAMLKGYLGVYCVESFHPAIVRWFYIHAPAVLRGQLSEAYRFSHKALSSPVSFAMSRLLTNCLTRPQFIAYRLGPKCLSVRLAECMGAMKVVWTAREVTAHDALMEKNDAVIFEQYRPDPACRDN